MKKGSEIWEPEGNVRPLLRDRFAKGEREKTWGRLFEAWLALTVG